METLTGNKTLYENYFRYRNVFTDTFMILLSVVFMAAMANIRIPLWPVPITMQTFGVFAVAFFFGSRKGTISMLAYVLAGLLGFGVFTGHKSGIAAIIGPTGGYLIGFIVAAFVVGLMVERGFGRSKKSVLMCMSIGSLIIYAFGLAVLGLNFDVPLWNLFMMGMIPFLVGDFLKIVAAVALFPYLWKGSERIN